MQRRRIIMDRKLQFQNAIMSGDWNEVRDVYEFLFKEPAPQCIVSDGGVGSLHDQINDLTTRLQDIYEITSPVVIQGPFDNKNDNNDDNKAMLGHVPYSLGNIKTVIPTPDDTRTYSKPQETRGLTTIVEKVKSADLDQIEFMTADVPNDGFEIAPVVVVNRDPYEATIVNCEACNQEFDYGSEYPVGHKIGDGGTMKCHKCRMKPSGGERTKVSTSARKKSRSRRGE